MLLLTSSADWSAQVGYKLHLYGSAERLILKALQLQLSFGFFVNSTRQDLLNYHTLFWLSIVAPHSTYMQSFLQQ
jgi:hypothetical protein